MKSPDPSIRVRYAPSPTGHLHVGSLRTALFNWLFARHHKGTYLVRIEDTDFERSRIEFTTSILESLAWCGLEADEPIVYQSQSGPVYAEVAEKLLQQGMVYRCYCTQEEVRTRVHAVSREGTEYFFYDGLCRDRTDQPDKPFVLRVRVPRDREEIVVEDMIHGTMRFPVATIDDFVIVRSDGTPMYNFTVVVDDARMGISHIIRGDDHIINTPRQILLYEACDYALPRFAHIPLILGSDGKKLSKRDAATAVIDYRALGYLAHALCNYLVRLGWSYGDREIMQRDELIQLFSLDGVGAKPALFDPAKLLWMNSVYIKEADPKFLLATIERDLDVRFREACALLSEQNLCAAIRLYRDRSKTLCELRDQVKRLCLRPEQYATELVLRPEQRAALVELCNALAADTATEAIQEPSFYKELVQQIIRTHTITFADIGLPVRIALTGSTHAPSIVDLMAVLGNNETRARLACIL